jgi:hypothetical protein
MKENNFSGRQIILQTTQAIRFARDDHSGMPLPRVSGRNQGTMIPTK